jgi:serine/threonine protein phosphatase PrpC
MKRNIPTAKILLTGFSQECRTGQGEDNTKTGAASRVTVLACLDGCGGSGARRYPEMGNETGARLAARTVRIAIANWFAAPQNGIDTYGLQNASAERIAQSLKQAIDAHLGEVNTRFTGMESGIKSRLSQTLPTTLSLALLEQTDAATRCIFIWAGDSRGYLLTEEGLRQMTEDDVVGGVDPDDLTCDGIMSQVVSASSSYVLHTREVRLDRPAIVLTATDGCFAYFRRPWSLKARFLRPLWKRTTFPAGGNV